MRLTIRPLSYSLGAEIAGVEICEPLSDAGFAEIYAAFLKYCVLLFRGQSLTQAQHVAFSRRFGEVDANESAPRKDYPEYPEILLNKPVPGSASSSYKGEVWHSDMSYTCAPAKASLLRGIEVPEVGGDTMFANMYLPYETLSDGMKKLIEGLHGIHTAGKKNRRIDLSSPARAAETQRLLRVAQPLVRVHPETGRKSLYIGQKVKQIAGMTEEESGPLIRFLCSHAARPQFVYRHRWQKNDLLIWDNRCTNHIAVGDYDKSRIRHMERTQVKGTPSGYVYDGV